jgi:hypothetical protein
LSSPCSIFLTPRPASFISELLFDHFSLEHIRLCLRNTCVGGKETLASAPKHDQAQFVSIKSYITLKIFFVLALVELPCVFISLCHILFLSPACEFFDLVLVVDVSS